MPKNSIKIKDVKIQVNELRLLIWRSKSNNVVKCIIQKKKSLINGLHRISITCI